jgi:hypothetical protein
MSIVVTLGDGRRMMRTGACNWCGVCCAGCVNLVYKWKTTRNVKAGEVVASPKDFIAECVVHDKPYAADYQVYVDKGCAGFPSHPVCTPLQCGFRWVEVSP